MSFDLNAVLKALNDGGIPAVRAYPASQQPDVTAVRSAVCYERVEAMQVGLLVTVLAPATLGGPACEDAALVAGEVLRRQGAVCTQGPCSYDSRSSLFSVEVHAVFFL